MKTVTSKAAAAVNRFWAADGELRACDVPRSVVAESSIVVHGRRVLSLLLSGELPKCTAGACDLSSVAAGLPPGWAVAVVPHSTLVDNVTRTRNTLRVTVDLAQAARHPLATEAVWIILLTLAVFALVVTLAYRVVYIY
jgi:hypothetical protein